MAMLYAKFQLSSCNGSLVITTELQVKIDFVRLPRYIFSEDYTTIHGPT
jgi:hypothetical protein